WSGIRLMQEQKVLPEYKQGQLLRMAALFSLCLLLSTVAVTILASLAPQALSAPALASFLSYSLLGSVGGLVAGRLFLSVTLTFLGLLAWAVVNNVQDRRVARDRKAYALLDEALKDKANDQFASTVELVGTLAATSQEPVTLLEAPSATAGAEAVVVT